MGAFHFAKPNIQKPVELSRENGTTLLNWIKVSNRSNSFAFRPQFWLLFGKVGLETRIFLNHGTAIFGPPDWTVKEDHLWRWITLTGKFPRGPERSISFLELTENSEKLILARWKATHIAKPCQRGDFRRRKKAWKSLHKCFCRVWQKRMTTAIWKVSTTTQNTYPFITWNCRVTGKCYEDWNFTY